MKNCALLSSNFCRVSSTCLIYHRAAKRRGDKFDQSMTQGKLLDNDTQLFHFYFYSNNDPTAPKGPRKQATEPILGTALLEKKNQLQPVEWESVAWLNYCKLGFIGK